MTTIPFEPRRFRSTAAYYARYRVPYPQALVAGVARRVALDPGTCVLDLGCGPGLLAIGFARLGMDVTAIDPEPEMLAAAREDAAESGLDIAFQQGSSYDLGPQLGSFKLVVMGRSFHWMDRPATLATLDTLIEPRGAVALFHDRRIVASPDWRDALERISVQFSPERMEAREARRSPRWAPHEAVLLDSPFSQVESLGRTWSRQIGIDDVVGRAYSMSVTSPEALGEARAAFETALRAELLALAPDGRFTEIVRAEAILAFRAAGK